MAPPRTQTTLRIPAAFADVAGVQVNGKTAEWLADTEAVGHPILKIVVKALAHTQVRILWSGDSVNDAANAARGTGKSEGDFKQVARGSFKWWMATAKSSKRDVPAPTLVDWGTPVSLSSLRAVDLEPWFNEQVSAIFASGKYVSPRSPGVSLALPSQGAGAWAGHLATLPVIDDTGLRKEAGAQGGKISMPNGIFFDTPSAPAARNIIFTSQWDNYPHDVTIPLDGRASHAYFMMAGSTNFMQSHLDNGEVVVTYTDGTSARLALRNPETWWPIEQDYFIDDYQFPYIGTLPPRIDLKTGTVRLLDVAQFKGQGREVPGGAATVLELALDSSKTLKCLTVRALSNDVVIGLMSATLVRAPSTERVR